MKNKGFFVDVGAHDPIRYSNTYLLHKNGWTGINIDPLPSCVERFKKMRPHDVNLNIGISDETGEIAYFDFDDPAYNTLNSKRADEVLRAGSTKLKEKRTIKADTLKNVLGTYCADKKIDLLTIDVETMELSVLKSNDWDKYRPNFVIMESLINKNAEITSVYNDPAIKFLTEKDYIVVAKVGVSVFLKNKYLEQ